jgi:hypothetical protein
MGGFLMSPDDIDSLALDLHNFLVDDMGLDLNENGDYEDLQSFLYEKLDRFVTRDRNYN